MAIDIKFDLAGNPEPPTIILANRNGNKIGQLKVSEESINLVDKFNDASEISFTVNKYIDNEITPFWDNITDFKLVHCKEWDTWFEIRVELDEETESVKTVFGTQLGYAELSQVMLYNIEINTEKDIERDDYKISILYDPQDSKASILDRMFEKASHYSIIHVDHTIANIQRSFNFDGTALVDACQEVAKEIGCLFVFHSNSDENGMPLRTVSVYDLYQNCNNTDCKHRGEFTDKCPKCGSTDIKYGYGDDTLIFVTADELATDGIQLVTDTDAVKNCFKLEAGDDLMTATVRNCNPNGTDYLWYFSDSLRADMSEELRNKLKDYDDKYKEYNSTYVINLDLDHVVKYNGLVDKYSSYYKKQYEEDLQRIATPIKGYASLMNAYYNVIDLGWYLKSGLMPPVKLSETTASDQVKLLTSSSLSPVAVGNADIVSEATANSAVLGMARTIIKSNYKVEIKSSEYNETSHTWTGIIAVTNYSDEEDAADSASISVRISDDLESYVRQKINKELNKEDVEDYSIVGLFKKEGINFTNALKEYALVPLTTFRDACQSCLDIMIDQRISSPKDNKDLYEGLYLPYYTKLLAIEAEMKVREEEIHIISGKYNLSDILVREGLQQKIEKHRDVIQKALNFQKFVGDELWMEFCTFRREDTYYNDNYISDGLNNAELFKKALEFYVAAENEIYKAAELQHSISSTLNNLLAIEKFEPLIESFQVGNWLRVRIDDKIFKLRLLEYEIDFGNFDNISVEFSDVTKIKNGITDIESILSQASSMATSYGAVLKQADKGSEARSTIREWLNEGLNSALVQIQNNTNEDIIIDKNGLLGRSYSEITEQYSPEQIKLTHNIIAYTDDNWKTVRQAIGKHLYNEYDTGKKMFVEKVGYGMSADFVTAGIVSGSQIVGGDIYSANYESGTSGTHLNLTEGDFDFAGGKIVYDSDTDNLTLKDVIIQWDNSTKPDMTVEDISGLGDYLDELGDLKDQIDGRAQTWYQDTDPSTSWTTDELKELHIGDLWHYTGETGKVNEVNRTKGSEWVWQKIDNEYQWVAIEISDEVFDAIDGKAQIFTSQPVPPYNIGDLWVQGSTGDILHCVESKTENESYEADDWVKSSKYTDDSALNTFIEKEYADDLQAIRDQIDGRAQTHYQDTDPSTEWETYEDKELHVGDLWHYTGETGEVNGTQRTKGSEWIWGLARVQGKYADILETVRDQTNGYAQSWYTQDEDPSESWTNDTIKAAHVGDLWHYAGDTISIGTTVIMAKDSEWVWQEVDDIYRWVKTDVLIEFFDTNDGQARIFVAQPTSATYSVNDLWVQEGANNILRCIRTRTGSFKEEDWQQIYQWVKSEMDVPDELFDIVDKKSQIFVDTPTPPYDKGDLWVQGEKGDIYHCTTSRSEGESYMKSDWVKSSKYTDDTAADKIVGGIGATMIGGQYVISPHIRGGDLEIVAENGTTSAKISSDGVLTATGVDIQGMIKTSATTTTLLKPTVTDVNTVLKIATGQETIPNNKLLSYDMNGSETVNASDALVMLKIIKGTLTYDYNTINFSRLSETPITVDINPSDKDKAIHIYGQNPWGTTIETYVGVDGIKTTDVVANHVMIGEDYVDATVDLYKSVDGTEDRVTLNEPVGNNYRWLFVTFGKSETPTDILGSVVVPILGDTHNFYFKSPLDDTVVKYNIDGNVLKPIYENGADSGGSVGICCVSVVGFKSSLGAVRELLTQI